MKSPFSATGDLGARIAAIRASVPPEAMADAKEQEARRRADVTARRVRLSGMPPRFANAKPSMPESREWAERAAHGGSANLVLTGRAGCGKTREACAALAIAAAERPVLFATFGDVLRAVRATYGGEGNEETALSRYRSVSVLCIDDLGKERPTADALEKLFALLDFRYGRMKPTVFTTQYTPQTLPRRLMAEGADYEQVDAIMRRVYQGAKAVAMDGR